MTPTTDDIRAWVTGRVAQLTGLPADEVDPREPVTRFGLDSVALITLAGEMEDRFGFRFRGNPFDETPTIDGLSRFLAERVSRCPPPRPE